MTALFCPFSLYICFPHNPSVWGSQPAPDQREGWRGIPGGPHHLFRLYIKIRNRRLVLYWYVSQSRNKIASSTITNAESD